MKGNKVLLVKLYLFHNQFIEKNRTFIVDQDKSSSMTPFLFNRELDYQYLDAKFQDDLYQAREVIGSFCETLDMELNILESALEQERYAAFLRVSQRLTKGMQVMGLMKEIEWVQRLRSHFALNGVNDIFKKNARSLSERLVELNSLFIIEQQRLELHLEQRLRHS